MPEIFFSSIDTNDSVEEAHSKLAKTAAGLKAVTVDVADAAKVSMEKMGAKSKDFTSALTILIAAGIIVFAIYMSYNLD